MKNVVIILIMLSIISCSTKKSIVGGYVYHTFPVDSRGWIFYFENDSTYTKICPVVRGVCWEGKWTTIGDTLFLEDIYYASRTEKELIGEDWTAKREKYIRQGKGWCNIYDIDKSPKKYFVIKKDKRTKKENMLEYIFSE